MAGQQRCRNTVVYAFNPKKGSSEERANHYKRLANFIDFCYQEVNDTESTGQKHMREDSSNVVKGFASTEEIPQLVDRSDASTHFKDVKSLHDIAMLEICCSKMRKEIIDIEQQKKEQYPNGICIEIRMRKSGAHSFSREQNLAPFVLRIPTDTTVYDLRQEIAR